MARRRRSSDRLPFDRQPFNRPPKKYNYALFDVNFRIVFNYVQLFKQPGDAQ